MESPSHQQQDLVLGPGAGTEQNDEVCVTFVIRGGDSATLERIQRLIKIRQANGEALVEGQTRLAEYQEFQQSRDDVALLDTLQDSRAQIAELEDRIADVERAGRVRAKEALSLAEERRVELRQKLEDQHDVLVGYDKELRDLTEKYDYYAEIRDRCIKVRILQEIASGDEEALAARLKLLAERIRHFSREAAEVAGLVESAKAELEQTVVELQLPRKELEAERNAAQQQLHRLHAHIEEQETILDRRFEESEAEIARRIAERLDEANMAKRTSNDRLQKLKIQALSTASALSDHEFRANALARTKKQLLHDFKVLQALRQRFSLEQNQELVELQEEVKAYQERLREHRLAFGDNTVERIEAFEAQVKAEASREWLERIEALREQHREDLRNAGDDFKEAVQRNSKQMGKLYADTIQREILQFEDHRAVEMQRCSQLRKQLAEMGDRRSSVRQELAQKRVDAAEQRQRVREETAQKAERLKQLKLSVRNALKERNASPEESIVLLRKAVQLHGATPDVLAACRRELERVRFVRDMMPAVVRHFDGVDYFQRLKRSGLDLADSRGDDSRQAAEDLDHLAISLCNAGIILEQNAKELLQQLDAYKTRFGRDFCFRGHVVREHLAHVQELLQSTNATEGGVEDETGLLPPPPPEDDDLDSSYDKRELDDVDDHDSSGYLPSEDRLPVLIDSETMQSRSPQKNLALRRAQEQGALSGGDSPGSSPRRGIYYFNDLDDTVGSLGYTRPDKMFEGGAVGNKTAKSAGSKPAMSFNRRGSVKYSTD